VAQHHDVGVIRCAAATTTLRGCQANDHRSRPDGGMSCPNSAASSILRERLNKARNPLRASWRST
jgi:hypothetical protein